MSPTRRHRKSSSSPPGVPSLHPARGKKTKIATTPPAAPAQAPVVGIGASAGGLEALKSFFGAMSPASGVVFVVVVHLDPTHDSLMPELLAKCTPLTVRQARDRQPLEGNHVYVIPPNRTLTLEKGLIRVREVADRRGLRGTIDQFFRSLADDLHEHQLRQPREHVLRSRLVLPRFVERRLDHRTEPRGRGARSRRQVNHLRQGHE